MANAVIKVSPVSMEHSAREHAAHCVEVGDFPQPELRYEH